MRILTRINLFNNKSRRLATAASLRYPLSRQVAITAADRDAIFLAVPLILASFVLSGTQLVFSSYAYTLARGKAWILRHPTELVVSASFLLVGLGWLRVYNRRFLRQGIPLLFEEEPEPAVQTLDLSHRALERGVPQPEGK